MNDYDAQECNIYGDPENHKADAILVVRLQYDGASR